MDATTREEWFSLSRIDREKKVIELIEDIDKMKHIISLYSEIHNYEESRGKQLGYELNTMEICQQIYEIYEQAGNKEPKESKREIFEVSGITYVRSTIKELIEIGWDFSPREWLTTWGKVVKRTGDKEFAYGVSPKWEIYISSDGHIYHTKVTQVFDKESDEILNGNGNSIVTVHVGWWEELLNDLKVSL